MLIEPTQSEMTSRGFYECFGLQIVLDVWLISRYLQSKPRQQQLQSHLQQEALLKATREHQLLHAGGKSQMVTGEKDKTGGRSL